MYVYRPQTKLSKILSTRGRCTPRGQTPPLGTHTPFGTHTPRHTLLSPWHTLLPRHTLPLPLVYTFSPWHTTPGQMPTAHWADTPLGRHPSHQTATATIGMHSCLFTIYSLTQSKCIQNLAPDSRMEISILKK